MTTLKAIQIENCYLLFKNQLFFVSLYVLNLKKFKENEK